MRFSRLKSFAATTLRIMSFLTLPTIIALWVFSYVGTTTISYGQRHDVAVPPPVAHKQRTTKVRLCGLANYRGSIECWRWDEWSPSFAIERGVHFPDEFGHPRFRLRNIFYPFGDSSGGN